MKVMLAAVAVCFGLVSTAALGDTAFQTKTAMNFTPLRDAAPSFLHRVKKVKCTCGSKSVEKDITCTGGKNPTCVCSSPGNNPSIECK